MSEEALLPCPFCGAPAVLRSPDYEIEVHCSQCAAKVENAPEFWNTRALSRPLGEWREAIEAAANIVEANAKSAQDMADLIAVQSPLPIADPTFSCEGLLQIAAAIRKLVPPTFVIRDQLPSAMSGPGSAGENA